REPASVHVAVPRVTAQTLPSLAPRGSGQPSGGFDLDAQDAVVTPARVAPTVGVVGDDPQCAVGRLEHVAQAAVLTLQEWLRLTDAVAVERHPPQRLTSQAGQVDPLVRHGEPARGGVARRPHVQRRDVLAAAVALALDVRPAVVLPRLDEVELVPRVLAELARERAPTGRPADAPHVVVTNGPDVRDEGVAGRGTAVGRNAQELPAEGVAVLRALHLVDVTRGRVQE